VTAVDHLHIEIREGEFFGLVGPNGAGKTTLIKLLATLITPTEGSAQVCGFELGEEDRLVRRSIGLISISERSFYFRLTGKQNLYFFGSLYGIPRRLLLTRIVEVLQIVGLEDWGDVTYMKYSAGMQRKLAIARGLLSDPPLLLMDEPTIGLDPGSANKVRSFLKAQLQESLSKTILFTTHQMEEADRMCDRVAVIDHGRLMACDTPRALKDGLDQMQAIEISINAEGPEHGADPPIPEIRTIDGVSGVARRPSPADDGSTVIRVVCESAEDVLQPVMESILSRGLPVVNVAVLEPTLEDVFISLTESGEEGTKDIDKATHVWTNYDDL
jgi:ABC-2 type transport system ATP-binding protein